MPGAVAGGVLVVALVALLSLEPEPGLEPVATTATASASASSAAPPPERSVAPAPEPAEPSSTPEATEQPSPDPALGARSLRYAAQPEMFVAAYPGKIGILVEVRSDSPRVVREVATFELVPGLADSSCYSLRTRGDEYLRHERFRVRLGPDDGSSLFSADATFCLRPAGRTGAVTLRSVNYPDHVVRYRDGQLFLDPDEPGETFQESAAFELVAPLEH